MGSLRFSIQDYLDLELELAAGQSHHKRTVADSAITSRVGILVHLSFHFTVQADQRTAGDSSSTLFLQGRFPPAIHW